MAVIWDSDGYFNKIIPAYNPIPYLVQDDGTSGLGGVPPLMYADVYFDGLYYKTLTSTSPLFITGIMSYWLFDIAGICQEYLNTRTPDITSNNYQQTFGSSKYFGASLAFVKFRNSTVDAYGVITPGGTPPVQGTVDTPPVPGDGWVSDTFMVVNGALQVTDLIDLENMVKKFRVTGTFLQSPGSPAYPQNVDTNYRVYGLSYLKNGNSYFNDYGQLPVIFCRHCFLGASSTNVSICLMILNRAGTVLYMNNLGSVVLNDYSIYYIPVGIKNLLAMFPGAAGSFATGYYYRVGLFDPALVGANKFVYASPKYFIQKYDGQIPPVQPLVAAANTPKHTRLWFQNYLGHYDQLNFIEREETLKVSSLPTEMPLSSLIGFSTSGSPGDYQSGRSLRSMARNDVRSNENNVVSGCFQEIDIPFIKQLMASAKVFIEFLSPEGGETPPVAMLLPVTIVDGEYSTLTFEDRYEYRISIKYTMSHENRIVRN